MGGDHCRRRNANNLEGGDDSSKGGTKPSALELEVAVDRQKTTI
jgi:hypothetical protein